MDASNYINIFKYVADCVAKEGNKCFTCNVNYAGFNMIVNIYNDHIFVKEDEEISYNAGYDDENDYELGIDNIDKPFLDLICEEIQKIYPILSDCIIPIGDILVICDYYTETHPNPDEKEKGIINAVNNFLEYFNEHPNKAKF